MPSNFALLLISMIIKLYRRRTNTGRHRLDRIAHPVLRTMRVSCGLSDGCRRPCRSGTYSIVSHGCAALMRTD